MNMSELLFILVLLMVVVGPQRLPEYAETLARWVRQLRRMAVGAREQVRAELGPEFDDVDWTKLDPRQYDPRRIVREALTDVWDAEPTKPVSSSGGPGVPVGQGMPGGPEMQTSQPAATDGAVPQRVDPDLVSSSGAEEPARSMSRDPERSAVAVPLGTSVLDGYGRAAADPASAAVPFDNEAT